MRLDQELLRRGLCESRSEAQEIITLGGVLVNDTVVTKQAKHVTEQDVISLTLRRKYVSRGGDKLEGVLADIFGGDDQIIKNLSGKVALDVGSSTGGFTDCLLLFGVARVDAVDVGTSQLHNKLRDDKRVALFENTDIRNFVSDKVHNVIVSDLSFISLKRVVDELITLGGKGTQYFLLLKPQFEVGKGNTKKGIVKDTALVENILKSYQKLAEEKGLINVSIKKCHIEGGDGNQEYFLYGILR
jgi:23S rRNA (cytidine1920-2'-O)/16S rRNA (cytidine1409-2'-O)-methyltransferase